MSSKIVTQFCIREMKVLEDVANKLNYTFSKTQGGLSIRAGYGTISATSTGFRHDSVDRNAVNNLKIEYSRAEALKKVDEEGSLYTVEENTDEITILVG